MVTDGRSPIWRAHSAFRVVAFLYALIWYFDQLPDYANPVLATVVILVMAGWTVFTVLRFRRRDGRTNRLVLMDQVVVCSLFLSSEFILTEHQMTEIHAPSVVTVYHASAVLSGAAQWGMFGGGLAGVAAAACNFLIRWYATYSMWMDTVLLLGAGLLVGLASDTARRSTERLARALRAEAATAERERLARSIHDSVLQVLARVRRRGNELGGDATELARLAGEQEIALRALVSTAPSEPAGEGADSAVDLSAKLQVLRTARVEVSVPPTPVSVAEPLGADLYSVVREALANVERHAGPDANAWVLLEDLGDEIVLSVRDDGPGIPAGRLRAAESEGRMGVAKSIKGRIAGLGGSISLDTEPGEGTEWEVRVPRADTAKSTERRGGSER
ncbi:DUF5931 domain-containing protein [Parasphingorhabdus pacifica]